MWVVMLAFVAWVLVGCTDVDPGYVAVRAWKRGEQAGQMEILPTGRHSVSVRASDFMFPTFRKNYVWTADEAEGSPTDESLTFPIEGLQINVDVGIEFAVDPTKVDVIFAEYRMGLDGITDGPMRNFVRDAILDESQSYNNMEQFITLNAISTLIDSVEQHTVEYFAPKGIVVTKVYLVNAPRYPPTVVASIESKIKATQLAIQTQNEVKQKEAEAQKRKIDADTAAYETLKAAEAEAEANRLREKSYTEAVLQAMWIDKWNGTLPATITGDASGLILNLK